MIVAFITEQQRRAYLRDGPACPYCRRAVLTPGRVKFRGRQGRCRVHCTSCRQSWVEVYKLTTIRAPRPRAVLKIFSGGDDE